MRPSPISRGIGILVLCLMHGCIIASLIDHMRTVMASDKPWLAAFYPVFYLAMVLLTLWCCYGPAMRKPFWFAMMFIGSPLALVILTAQSAWVLFRIHWGAFIRQEYEIPELSLWWFNFCQRMAGVTREEQTP